MKDNGTLANYEKLKSCLTSSMILFAECYLAKLGEPIPVAEITEATNRTCGDLANCRKKLEKEFGFVFEKRKLGGGHIAYALVEVQDPSKADKNEYLWSIALSRRTLNDGVKPMKGSERSGKREVRKTNAMLYHPQVGKVKVTNAREFARRYFVSQNRVSMLIRGDIPSVKGWTLLSNN